MCVEYWSNLNQVVLTEPGRDNVPEALYSTCTFNQKISILVVSGTC